MKNVLQGLSLLSGTLSETSTDRLPSTNPANARDLLATFGCATREQIATACARAREAFAKWKRTPAPIRASVIQNFGRQADQGGAW